MRTIPPLESAEKKFQSFSKSMKDKANENLMTFGYIDELITRGLLIGPHLLSQIGQLKSEELISQKHPLTDEGIVSSLKALYDHMNAPYDHNTLFITFTLIKALRDKTPLPAEPQ